jgi:uncharacterized membrane protein YkoI
MKANRDSKPAILSLALVIGPATLYGDHEIQLKDSPAPVQQTIQRYQENGELKRIERQTYNGAPIFEVIIKRPGPNRELHITESGAVLENDPNFAAQPESLQTRKLRLSDLPATVQNTIRTQAGDSPVDDINQTSHNGRTVYEVEFQRSGRNQEVHIAGDGTLLPLEPRQLIAGDRKMTFVDLPSTVQRAVQNEVGTGKINLVERKVRRGRTLYQVTYSRNGQQRDLFVTESGTVIRSGLSPDAIAGQSSAPVVLRNARKVTFSELPASVQNTIRAQAAGAPIEDIDQGTLNGRAAYQAAFKRDGRHTELTVAEDGSVVSGAPAPVRDAVRSAEAAIPLRDSKKVTFKDLPTAVQNTVRAQAGPAAIEDIDKGTLNGRVVYEAAFKKDGRHTELRVAEDGALVGTVSAETSVPQP